MNAVVVALRGASSAEEIFNVLGLPFDQAVVNVNRLHILKRFHQYLAEAGGLGDGDGARAFADARRLLARAYGDFVVSTALEQKALKVFRRGSTQCIPVAQLRGARGAGTTPRKES